MQAVERTPNMTVLAAALNAANLTSVFSNPNLTYTLFAPNGERPGICSEYLVPDSGCAPWLHGQYVDLNAGRILRIPVPELSGLTSTMRTLAFAWRLNHDA